MSVPSRLLENLTRVLRSSWGLDVVSQPFAIQRYNAAVLEIDHAEWTVQTFGRSVNVIWNTDPPPLTRAEHCW